MSLPPVTVHIKRKATDEPVDFLRVHETHGKRQRRAADFVFSRQAPKPQNDTTSTRVQDGPQGSESSSQDNCLGLVAAMSQSTSIQVTDSGPSRRDDGAHVPKITSKQSSTSPSRQSPAGSDGSIETRPITQTRRFHMSRTPSKAMGAVPGGQIRKRVAKAQPAVFIERKERSRESPKKIQLPGHSSRSRNSSETTHVEAEQARDQKKPGLAARSQISNLPPAQIKQPNLSTQNVRLPSGLMMPWDVNSEQLAAEMQAYTLQEIGKNLADAAAPRSGVHVPLGGDRPKKQSKFKPKKPALRYHERHPDEVLDSPSNMDLEESFSDEEMGDDAEYIIDTYVRMPADALLHTSEGESNIGLLILDSQPDIEKFYLEDSESEEEDEDEEEDENAENHYTADYPDDEVESDDEYDRNPYHYRTHNASDLEEFDEDDATFSDDDADDSKYPWANRAWMKRSEKSGGLLDGAED